MDPVEAESLFFEHIPERFCRRALSMIFDARRRAWDDCNARYAPTEAENVRPWVTRGEVEGGLRAAADLHDGMSHRVVKASGSGWNHTEVLAGPVLLTAGAVQSPCGPVNKADFRLSLAASNQGSLFDGGPMGSHMYVMLLHSGFRSYLPDVQRKFGHLAASAYLAFPAADLDSYVAQINLFDRFPDIVEGALPQEWDQEAVVKFMYNARRSSWPKIS